GGNLTCKNPGSGDELWTLTALKLPGDGEAIGFNLDNHNTVDEEEGCGIQDLEGGIDNALGMLLGLAGNFSEDLDIQGIIDDAIANGDISIVATVTGYEGAGDDEVLLSLAVNGEKISALQDVCGRVSGNGDITVELSTLPLTIPEINIGEEPVSLTLDLSNVRIVISAPGANTSTDAVIGGAVLFDDGQGGGLWTDLESLLGSLDLPIEPEAIKDIAAGLLDIRSSANGPCDSISLGATVEFSKA